MDRNDDEPDELKDYVNLMTGHQSNLRAFIVSLMPGSQDVADVLQETNAALWLKRHRFEAGSNFGAWAFQIARFEVMRQRGRNKRLQLIVFSDELLEILAETDMPENPDARLAALDGCLDKLSDTQRRIVHERYTAGCSLEKYAAETGRSPGSIRMALLRIRDILKDCVNHTLAEQSR
jgi:RNA polymerase sigma-70 factor (ECF subfamily)